MRLRQLDLTRYGKFTDFSIDFGERSATGPDLHIIYGPNEAGKSTTFSAILDLLYGIDKRSRYGFLHPYATMQLSGTIELGGRDVRFTRIKRDQQSLLDLNGAPIADAAILAELGGIDRAAFQTMFSLDDETLEQGGESILASRGELGELLFSASSGLSALSQRLTELRADGDRFFKPRGHTHELAQHKKALDALKARGEALDIAASTFARLIEARETARARYSAAVQELATEKSTLARLQNSLLAHPRYLSLLEGRRLIAPLLDLPGAPPAWEDDIRDLELEAARLETAEQLNAQGRTRLAAELAAITVDEALLGLAGAFDDLGDLRARYVTSEKDLPSRRVRRSEVDGAIDAVMRRLDRPADSDPAELVLKPAIRGQLDDLIAGRARIDESLRLAEAEQDRSERDLRAAQGRLWGPGEGAFAALSETAAHRLAAALDALRASECAARLRLAGEEQGETRDRLATQIERLAPWTGNPQALVAMTVPMADTLESWGAESDDLADRRRTSEAEITRATEAVATADAQLSVLAGVGGLVTDGQAQAIRRDRETAWLAHRTHLDAGSAETFEALLRQDDAIGATRLARVSEQARVTEVALQKASAETQLAGHRDRLAQIDARQTELARTIAGAVAAISPDMPPNWSPRRLATWIEARREVLATLASLARTGDRIAGAQAEVQKLEANLRDALVTAGDNPDTPADQLVFRAEDRIEADRRTKASQAETMRLERDLQERRATLAAARIQLDSWTTQWRSACGACWLGGDEQLPTPAAVRGIFAELEPLAVEIKARGELAYRIDAMESDQRKYGDRVAELVDKAGLAPAHSPAESDRMLAAAIAEARHQAAARDSATTRRVELEAQAQRLEDDRARFDGRLNAMCAHFAVATLAEVAARLHDLRLRRELEARIAGAASDMLQTLGLADLAEAETRLQAFDVEAARLDIAQATTLVENEDIRVRDLFAELRKASDAVDAVDGDDAVARLEEQRRTLLLQIEDSALTWLKRKLGVTAAELALRLYREKHRSALLRRASEAFSLVSRNAYTRLSTQAEKDGEILVAIAADGSSKRAADLSKGTRFQLYLALRVAGYEELVSSRPSVPFLADDILETFDDFRSEETLKVFAGMAGFGQVIYLTHHRHLCEIARQVCPSVRIHDLQAVRKAEG